MTYPADASARSSNPALVMTLMMMLTIVPLAQAQPRVPDDTVVRTSAPDPEIKDGPEDRFRSRVREEVADWRLKMKAFDEKTEARSQRHIDAAERRLRAAWDETEVEARNVQTATARNWARTKRAYEVASHRMAVAWDKASF